MSLVRHHSARLVAQQPHPMANSIPCRLAYLVTPKPELLKALGLEAKGGHEVCRPTIIITPLRDYEDAFEGWKRAWMTKAKRDFVSEFTDVCSEDIPEFTAQLSDPECFDRWWSISEVDVLEIDSAWTPS
jgi:hypothetical protein